MKQMRFVILFALAALAVATTQATDSLEQVFRSPPSDAKVRTYGWHWIQGHATKEGITADLENMAKAGFAGAVIYNGGNPPSKEKRQPFILEEGSAVEYLSEKHLGLLRHAADEAARLGLELGMHIGAGWSGAGGPWITQNPKYASKSIHIGERKVKGGATFQWKRPVYDPASGIGFVGCVAFRIPDSESATGKPTLVPRIDDKTGKGGGLWNILVAHFKHEEKIVPFADGKSIPAEARVNSATIHNLGPLIDEAGTLSWKAPEGDWIVLTAEYRPNLSNVAMIMAHPSGNGSDSDRTSPEALEFHWKHGVQPVLDRLGEHVGKTFQYIQHDSHESGGHTWGAGFEKRFREMHGYDLTLWLPALTGRVIDNPDRTERFLRDYRKTLEMGFVDGFVKTTSRLCRERGMRFVLQPYCRGSFGGLSSGAAADIVQGEFWQGGGPNAFDARAAMVSSIAHTTGKKLVTAESFTSYLSHSNAERSFGEIKANGDANWCHGYNAFWLHELAHNPYPGLRPGMYFGIWGINCNPNALPWRDQFPAWGAYIARSQSLLQEGRYVADFLLHDPSDLAVTAPTTGFPSGWRFDFAHDDTIMALRVENGLLQLPSGMEYRCLILPHDVPHFNYRRYNPEVLAHIAKLVKGGAHVIGLKPLSTWTLKDEANADKTVKELADTLWRGFEEGKKGGNTHGKGKVWWNYAPEEWAAEVGLARDFDPGEEPKLRFIHRRDDATGADWYFVANPENRAPSSMVRFRVAGRIPELWDSVSGEIREAPVWQDNGDGTTGVRLQLPRSGSIFVVFRKPSSGRDPMVEFADPAGYTGKVDSMPMVLDGGRPGVLAFESGRFTGKTKSDKAVSAEVTVPAPTVLDGSWTVTFDPSLGGPDKPVVFDRLASLHEHADPKIKCYSGPAVYAKTIEIPAELLGEGKRLLLDLGEVKELAEVRINGQKVAVAWCPPMAVDITTFAKPGKNELEIIAVNYWRNRWIGDEQLPADIETVTPAWAGEKARSPVKFPDWAKQGKKSPNGRILFSTFMPWGKEDQIAPAGLLGPVTLRGGVEAEMK